jgi:hypothetical protein
LEGRRSRKEVWRRSSGMQKGIEKQRERGEWLDALWEGGKKAIGEAEGRRMLNVL